MNRLFYALLMSVCILFVGCSNDVIKDRKIKDIEIETTERKVTEAKTEESKNLETKTPEIKDTETKEKVGNQAYATPILIKNYYIGGLVDGTLYNAEEFYNKNAVIMKDFEYDVYKSGKKLGIFKGSEPIYPISGESLKKSPYNPDYAYMELYDKDNQTVDFDIALKANWNLFPRDYQRQDTNQSVYQEMLDKVLVEEGIEKPVSYIKEIIRVDLDGDGTEEVIITANNTTDNQFHGTKKGDHAIVLFRKIVDGKVHQEIVLKDLRLEDPEFPNLFRYLYEVNEIADLDGDGVMEVIIKGWYYEGEAYYIYKLTGNKLELVAVNGFGV